MNTTRKQKTSLARSMSFDMWGELCGSETFLRALDSDIGVARHYAERYALAANPKEEIESWSREMCQGQDYLGLDIRPPQYRVRA